MSNTNSIQNTNICIFGLGYVGLPLAVEFGKKISTIGYDINANRIQKLKAGIDDTHEVDPEDLKSSNFLKLSSNIADVSMCNLYIVTVPTPVDLYNRPNLQPLFDSTKEIGKILNIGDIVIYESTVYPGATEDDCVPILEKNSGLKFNKDFFVGYSPERINPGDRMHRLPSITKIISGSTPKVTEFIDKIYSLIITAGTYKAPSIKVAEASKVIENTQRDLNIALINELAIIFEKLEIDTASVLDAASTKWNFLNFKPGLVGGHCIGVDPYYLTHKAESVGYHPELILAGRRINDSMASHAAKIMLKLMLKKTIEIIGSRILIMGLTFKENCPDLRNTKVIDLINELNDFGVKVDVHDPICSPEQAKNEYNIEIKKEIPKEHYDGVIICVAHNEFKNYGISFIKSLCKKSHVIYDLKYIFSKSECDARL